MIMAKKNVSAIVFHLTVNGNRTTEEVVRAGNYDRVDERITSENFPMRSCPDGQVTIEFIEFNRNVSSEEAIEKARERGLERPTYEDAPFFGEQFPDEQRKKPIVFLHKPWLAPDGRLSVLVLYGTSLERYLFLNFFDYRWDRNYVFAFVRK